MRFEKGCIEVVIELRVVQFCSEIIRVILKLDEHVARARFEITRIISDQIALHSVQLPLFLLIKVNDMRNKRIGQEVG